MYRFEYFQEKDELIWDDFIKNKSVNGTFLQGRAFLNYHPKERFKDVSLIIYNEKNNVAALCPACVINSEKGKCFFAHKGSTFGGLIVDKKHYCAKYIFPLVEELKNFLKEEGYAEVYLKQTPDIFSKENAALFEYVYHYYGFKEYKELSTYVDFNSYKEVLVSNFAQGKRTNVHNCMKENLRLEELLEDAQISKFYDILCENLEKHGVKPVHTLEELLDLKKNCLPQEIGFFGVYKEEEMLAGSMMFYFENSNCAHTQYLGARQAYNKLSPMTFMYFCMLEEMKKRGFSKVSWGTVTEDMGTVFNMGLATSKEDFGSCYTNNKTYYLKL